MAKKNPIGTFTKELPQNIFAGFVVSLIALPLGLGLAIASDAPPFLELLRQLLEGLLWLSLEGLMSLLLDLETA